MRLVCVTCRMTRYGHWRTKAASSAISKGIAMRSSKGTIYTTRGILLSLSLNAVFVTGLSACDEKNGPYEDAEVQENFSQYWPEFEFGVAQCLAHHGLRVIGSQAYERRWPERIKEYPGFDKDDARAYAEVRSLLDRMEIKAIFCERDVNDLKLKDVSFIYEDTLHDPNQYTHRIIFYSFNDEKDKADAESVHESLISLNRPHWYLNKKKWDFDAGEY